MTLRSPAWMRPARGRIGALCAVAVVCSAGVCLGQGGPRTIVTARATSSETTFIGVMGGVAQPGAYAERERFPLLVDVVRHAGGLTDDATGNVRVVRNGRAGQQTFYSPSLDYRLHSGDLLVVDTLPPHQSRQRIAEPGRELGLVGPAAVQLAFLNVVDRPVVLKMRPENATLAQITRFLNQSPTLASTIRVVETGPQYTRGDRDVHTQLVTGSVVIFDPSGIDVAGLPGLPPVIGEEHLAGPRTLQNDPSAAPVERPLPTAPPLVTDNASRGVLAAPATMTRPGGVPATNASLSRNPLGSPSNPFAGNAVPTPPLDLDRPLPNGPSFADGPSFAPQPSASEATGAPFLEGRPAIVENVPAATQQPAAALPSRTAAVEPEPKRGAEPKGQTATERAATDKAAAAPAAADTGSLAIVIGVLATAGILIWLLSRRPNPTAAETTAAPVVEPEVAPEVAAAAAARRYRLDVAREEPARAAHASGLGRSTLDELIDGDVPFQEEPVNLPASMQLFGKSTGERRFRVDAVEAPVRKGPRRPHFADIPVRRGERVAANVAAESDTADEDETPTDAPSRVRMLDRVLTVVHGANRR